MRTRVAPPSAFVLARCLATAIVVSSMACGLPMPPGGHDDRRFSTTLLVLPDDGPDALVAMIATARRRVWIEMYMLTDERALAALVDARARGVDVRVLLEPAPYAATTANQDAFLALGRAGVDVRWFAVVDGLVHAKFLLVDDTGVIQTLNLTTAGLTRNREYVVIDSDPADVRDLDALWRGDATGAAPELARTSGASRVLTSPIDARARLTEVVDAAARSIAIEVEEISDAGFVARLAAARGRGIAISLVVPATDRSAATNAAASRLSAAGVDVRAEVGPTLHAKAMVVDDRVAYVGSVNFTRASLDDNREVGLLVTDPLLVARVKATIAGDAAHGAAL